MALSEANKADVRRLLGYPDVNREPHWTLEGAMTAVSSAGEDQVTSLLSKLSTLEGKLEDAWGQAHVTRVEDIHFAGGRGVATLRREGARLTRQLAGVFGVVVRDAAPFGSGSSAGIAGRG